MARKKANVQRPAEVLVPPVEGEGPTDGQSEGSKQVSQPGPIEHLYALGAEAVLVISRADTVSYKFKFPGEEQPLELSLPAGSYVICRVPDPAGVEPGLRPVVNPKKKN